MRFLWEACCTFSWPYKNKFVLKWIIFHKANSYDYWKDSISLRRGVKFDISQNFWKNSRRWDLGVPNPEASFPRKEYDITIYEATGANSPACISPVWPGSRRVTGLEKTSQSCLVGSEQVRAWAYALGTSTRFHATCWCRPLLLNDMPLGIPPPSRVFMSLAPSFPAAVCRLS